MKLFLETLLQQVVGKKVGAFALTDINCVMIALELLKLFYRY